MGATKVLIEKYRKKLYIETGVAAGDGLQAAIDAGVERLWGIECNMELFSSSARRFKGNSKVVICLGKSEEYLIVLLKAAEFEPSGKAIIFLDAHAVDVVPKHGETYPLIEELKIIKEVCRNTHTIMIDDVRLFGKELAPKEDVLKAIYAINPDYKIDYEDSSTDKADVLVAHL